MTQGDTTDSGPIKVVEQSQVPGFEDEIVGQEREPDSEDGSDEADLDEEQQQWTNQFTATIKYEEEDEGREHERGTRTPAREAQVSQRPASGGGPSGGSSGSVQYEGRLPR